MKLTEVCDFQGGSQPPKEEWSFECHDGYIRMLQIRDFTQSERVTPEYIKIRGNIKTCTTDDILIARYGASLGKILTGLAGAYNVAIMRTIPDEKYLRKKYLYYYLQSPFFQNCILNVGSRAAQAGFNKDDLSEIEIQCPALIVQDCIIKQMEKLDTIIKYRKEELSKLDTLVKSRFIEMFGDININEKSWATERMEDICDSIGDGLHGTPKYDDKGRIPFINGNNLNGRIIHTSTTKYVGDDEYSRLFIHLSNNAILLSINGTLGNLAYYNNEKVCLGKSAAYFNVKQDYNRTFVYELMRTEHFQQYLESNSTKSTIKNVGLKTLRDYRIITPPITLQNQFADFVTQADKSKSVLQKLLEKQEILRAALMQEYFG